MSIHCGSLAADDQRVVRLPSTAAEQGVPVLWIDEQVTGRFSAMLVPVPVGAGVAVGVGVGVIVPGIHLYVATAPAGSVALTDCPPVRILNVALAVPALNAITTSEPPGFLKATFS